MSLVDRLNAELAKLKLLPLTSDQIECLNDLARVEEAAAMLDDLHVRCGVQLRLPKPEDVALPFQDEDKAREAAEAHARNFDAVCIEEIATDNSRSYGGDEYRVLGFNGPEAALAAACHPCRTAYWVAGNEQETE
jgi:hypothetical protein